MRRVVVVAFLQFGLPKFFPLLPPAAPLGNAGGTGKSGIMRTPSATSPAPAPPKALPKIAATNGGISVEDIRALKELVGRIGADSVRELAEVLSD